jgi:sugar O-acyltransferase (sialic acid O-acetyltransferase NeuD family)
MIPVPLVVLGAGGNSLSIIDAVIETNRKSNSGPLYDLRGFLDDLPENQGRSVLGFPVLGTLADAHRLDPSWRFINGIASETSYRLKPATNDRTGLSRTRFESVVHPGATVSPNARVGVGTAIMAGSVICAEAEIGDHVIILQNTVVNHHSSVGDYATLSSGITVLGFVTIRRNAFVGGGASLRPRISIGEGALVGMGAVVVKDVPPGVTVAGNPARQMREKTASV